MAIGSILLGGVADKIGRRPTILGCLVVMAGGMLVATTATGLVDLSSGASSPASASAACSRRSTRSRPSSRTTRRRHLNVSLMSIGYPLGAVVGGLVAARAAAGPRLAGGLLLRRRGHGGADSDRLLLRARIGSLAGAQTAGRRARDVNRAMARMGHPTVSALPALAADARRKSVADIFAPGLRRHAPSIVTLAYFFHITTFYFIVKWVPKIVVDLGFAASSAAGVLVWTNVGGAIGGAMFGLLTQRYGVKALTIGVLLLRR